MNLNESSRDTLFLLLAVLGIGIIIGLLLAPRKGNSRVNDDSNRSSRNTSNLVFGNIVIGSNNGQDPVMTFGNEDTDDR
jgi:hypothetical protein